MTEVWETRHCSNTAVTFQELEPIKPVEIMGCGPSSGEGSTCSSPHPPHPVTVSLWGSTWSEPGRPAAWKLKLRRQNLAFPPRPLELTLKVTGDSAMILSQKSSTGEGMDEWWQESINLMCFKTILFFFFSVCCATACEILLPQLGMEPCPLQWKLRVLTTAQGSPQESVSLVRLTTSQTPTHPPEVKGSSRNGSSWVMFTVLVIAILPRGCYQQSPLLSK